MNKKIFIHLFFLFFLFTKAIADLNTKCEKCELMCLEDPPPSNCGYNCPARIDVKGVWDYSVQADFLYWQPKQKGIALALLTSTDLNGLSKTSLTDFEYNFVPAFKAGLGLSSDDDGWNLLVLYTRVYSSTSKKVEFNSSLLGSELGKKYFTSLWTTNDESENEIFSNFVKSKWKLRFNIIDLNLGRSYFAGKKLLLHPFCGLKGGLINQVLNAESRGVDKSDQNNSSSSKNHLRSWLIGPSFGINTNWQLGKGFRFYADAEGSLFFDHFKLCKDEDISSSSPLKLVIKTKNKTINSSLNSSLGFGWGSYFNEKNWHLDFSMGYDFEIFYEQNYLQYLNSLFDLHEEFSPDSLIFQGLNMKLQIDF